MVRVLVTLANFELPPPAHLSQREIPDFGEISGLGFQTDAPIAFYSLFHNGFKYSRRPNVQWIFDTEAVRPAIFPYLQRIQHYMHDVQGSQETTILVAGMSRVNSERTMVAVTRMKYEPQEGWEEWYSRYTVMSRFSVARSRFTPDISWA